MIATPLRYQYTYYSITFILWYQYNGKSKDENSKVKRRNCTIITGKISDNIKRRISPFKNIYYNFPIILAGLYRPISQFLYKSHKIHSKFKPYIYVLETIEAKTDKWSRTDLINKRLNFQPLHLSVLGRFVEQR